MFKLTMALKGQLIALGAAVAGATDDQFQSGCMKMLVEGKMTAAELQKLSTEEAKPLDASAALADMVKSAVAAALAGIGSKPALEAKSEESDIKKALEALGTKSFSSGDMSSADTKSAATVLAGAAKDSANVEIRVKGFGERYNGDRKSLYYPESTQSGQKHRLAGKQAQYGGYKLDSISERGKAVGGAWFKFQLLSTTDPRHIPQCLKMTAEDHKLVEYALNECAFSGDIHGQKESESESNKQISVIRRKLTSFEIKGVLDDSTSGGIEIAPIEFDDALVTTPVLNGELFPLVNVVPVTRGRRMKGGSVANPTFSNTAEGTAITPFDTTAFVSAFDTTIFPTTGAMEIGLDFEDDSPTNIGQIILDKYGEKALEWLDRVIAAGNGTTEPQGIVNASGIVTVNSDNGTGGPATVSDYEGLLFGVAKQFRKAKGERNVFIGNETSYRRARAIAVGPSDERRVFGMTHSNYQLLDMDYKIQNNMTNSQIAFANLGYYRMYRRLGLSVRMETAGNYLAIRNIRLVIVRMRYGGKLELGGAASLIADGQA